MITYVLIISKQFPLSHPKAGQPTFFFEKIANTRIPWKCPSIKIHTIRKNYNLWESRINKVKEGKAQLSLRYWSGKPYHSKQIEMFRLTKEHNVGIQYIWLYRPPAQNSGLDGAIDTISLAPWEFHGIEQLAKNDGLSVADFIDWFFPKGKSDVLFTGGIIHFTDFRYQ